MYLEYSFVKIASKLDDPIARGILITLFGSDEQGPWEISSITIPLTELKKELDNLD